MIESAHDSSSGIASDDQAGPASSPPSTSSYRDASSKASSGYAETSTGFRYYDIDDDDADDDDDEDDDFGFPRPRRMLTQAQVHVSYAPSSASQRPRDMTSQSDNGCQRSQARVKNNKNLSCQVSKPPNTYSGHPYINTNIAKAKGLCYFDVLPDNVITKIFSCLPSDQLCRNALVCRRFYDTVWQPVLWTCIRISDPYVDIDTALRVLTKRLSCETPHVCLMVDRIYLNGCLNLTDRGIYTIAKRCLDLRHLEIANCPEVTNIALFELVSRCVNLEYLNVSGMYLPTSLSIVGLL